MDWHSNERRPIGVKVVLVTALGAVELPALLLEDPSELPDGDPGSRWVTLRR